MTREKGAPVRLSMIALWTKGRNFIAPPKTPQ